MHDEGFCPLSALMQMMSEQAPGASSYRCIPMSRWHHYVVHRERGSLEVRTAVQPGRLPTWPCRSGRSPWRPALPVRDNFSDTIE